jgi:MFS transporter, putative metabolite:H+ symporter
MVGSVRPFGRQRAVWLAVLAAALGYFVDAYDLILYNIVRVQSLCGIGVPQDRTLEVGVDLLNAQLVGMLVGGVLWGVWGDRRGRRSVLFGSILVYSVATAMNGLVRSVPEYLVCRTLAGLGLAGELGAGVTLVAELMPRESRGFGTMIVAAVGVVGVVVASLVGDVFDWRTAYFVGGGLGLALLLLRIGVSESGLFDALREQHAAQGSLRLLFSRWDRVRRYACVVLVALPIWFLIGIVITFSPELGRALGLDPAPSAGRAVLFYYVGLTLGDLTTGAWSQHLRARKRVISVFLLLTAGAMAVTFLTGGTSLAWLYGCCGLLGWTSGYWAVFITTSAEQFGTNLRATVATTAPNLVRGATVPLAIAFKLLGPRLGVVPTAAVLGAVTLIVAAISLRALDETFGRDLDFVER